MISSYEIFPRIAREALARPLYHIGILLIELFAVVRGVQSFFDEVIRRS